MTGFASDFLKETGQEPTRRRSLEMEMRGQDRKILQVSKEPIIDETPIGD